MTDLDYTCPDWRSALTKDEFALVRDQYGTCDFNFYMANFFLLEDSFVKNGKKFADIVPEKVYTKIQEWCFWNRGFVPMLVYNKRFKSEFEWESFVSTPDLTVRTILDSQVLGYREKKDGLYVWASSVTHILSSIKKDCYVGGISLPLVPGIESFELCGSYAYSIRPFNVSGKFGPIEFVPRPLCASPSTSWEEGAIGFFDRDGVVQEYRVKWYPSTEIEIVNGKVDDLEFPGIEDGIYEVAYDKNVLKIICPRPFKQHDKFYSRIRLLPSLIDCPHAVERVESCSPFFSDGLFPRTIEYGNMSLFDKFRAFYEFHLPPGSVLKKVRSQFDTCRDCGKTQCVVPCENGSPDRFVKIFRDRFEIVHFSSGSKVNYDRSGTRMIAKFDVNFSGVERIVKYFQGEFLLTGIRGATYKSLGVPVFRLSQYDSEFANYAIHAPVDRKKGVFPYDQRDSNFFSWEIRKKKSIEVKLGIIGSIDYVRDRNGLSRIVFGEQEGKRMVIYSSCLLDRSDVEKLRDQFDFSTSNSQIVLGIKAGVS